MAGFTREVAYRIFAQELRDTTVALERDSDDAYAPQYVLTPTGAKVNRVFVVGTLTEKEDIGTDTEYWRARISDPTGASFIYAGQYQPDATRALVDATVADADAETPEFLAVVGKVSIYTTEDGNVLTSLRPETISIVDAETRDRWVLETARQTLDRIKRLEDGSSENLAMVEEHYSLDLEQYRQMVVSALESLV
ncbi:MAG: DNA-binding protein [Methanosarcinales archaeon]|nr:DNA-binding protein [Methanosarcinales archaeon]